MISQSELKEKHQLLRTASWKEMQQYLMEWNNSIEVLTAIEKTHGFNFVEGLVIFPNNDVENKIKNLPEIFKEQSFEFLGFLFASFYPKQIDLAHIINAISTLPINWHTVESHLNKKLLFTFLNDDSLNNFEDFESFFKVLEKQNYDFNCTDHNGNNLLHVCQAKFLKQIQDRIKLNAYWLNNKKEIFFEAHINKIKKGYIGANEAQLCLFLNSLNMTLFPKEAEKSLINSHSFLKSQAQAYNSLPNKNGLVAPFLEKTILLFENAIHAKNDYGKIKL